MTPVFILPVLPDNLKFPSPMSGRQHHCFHFWAWKNVFDFSQYTFYIWLAFFLFRMPFFMNKNDFLHCDVNLCIPFNCQAPLSKKHSIT